MIGGIIAAVLYVVLSALIGLMARAIVDPYGHFSNRSDWTQAVLIGVFWPVMLIYAVGVWAYYTWLKK